MTDIAHLVLRCRSGDTQAIEQLVEKFRPRLLRLALSILDDAAEADEAAQDALMAALRALDRFRAEAALSTWLYQITLNECRGRLRKRQARTRLQGVLQALLGREASGRHLEERAFQTEAERHLWQAVRGLPERERETVVLRYYHDLSIREIAAVMAVSERMIQKRLHQAHERLHGQLRGKVEWP